MPGRKPTPKQLEVYREMLERMRAEITGDMSRLEQDAFGDDRGKGGVDATLDGGSDSYSMEFSLELLRMDGDSLEKIDGALDRIEAGEFGRCVTCQAWIQKGRLDMVPHAKTCIECQRAQEAS